MPALWLGSLPRLTTYTHANANPSTITHTVMPGDVPGILPYRKTSRQLSPGLYRRLSR
jgi:hypothetical protein